MKINFTLQDIKKIKEDNFIKKKVISLKKLKNLIMNLKNFKKN